MRKKKIKLLLVFLLLFGLAGYFREFFFVHINRIMWGKFYNTTSYEHEIMPLVMEPFNMLSYEALYYLKYFFTVLWTGLLFGLNYLAVKKLTSNLFLIKVLIYTYALLLIGSGLSMLYGYFVMGRLQDDEYTLSRWLMGIAQSPIICLILLASEKLYIKSTAHD